MTISFDISAIPYGTGVSRYTSNLALALAKELHEDLQLFGSAFRQYPKLKKYGGRIYPLPPSVITRLFHDYNLPIDYFIGKADVFHSWDWYLPKATKARTVITIHDLALFKYPDIAHPEIRAHHEAVIERIKRFKPQIITVSRATRNDLIELFDVNPNDITVIYEALPEEFKIHDSVEVELPKKPYFLMVGTLEPRKNYQRQIEAWRKFKKDFDLVIIGKDGWEEIPEEDGIIRKKYLSPGELVTYYEHAELLLYCSLYEGFGLPILEAIHCGTPVVTSNCSSMAEIASNETAIMLADPLSVESIQYVIDQYLTEIDFDDHVFAAKRKLAEKFSWGKAAKETIEVYKKALV